MGFVIFIHVVVCVLLIITILMQAGRGGGLAESFASAESMFGTQTNSFMVKVSTILAVIFLTTSLLLAINSAKGHKSLMSAGKISSQTQDSMKDKAAEPTVVVSEPKSVDVKDVTEQAPSAVVTNTAK